MVDKPAAEGEFCFESVEIRRSALGIDACGMAADRFDACPFRCANALRARLIHVFSARVLECAKRSQSAKNFSAIQLSFNRKPTQTRTDGADYGQSRCCRFRLPWVPG